ncbi:hypothetical protein [Micromonospora sp. NPDC051296]|uniref:hypothetical protein n=1 Tax=Micromonospora sp. NPDC051296 TaxID=3155046 RepID=UPI003429AB4B
MGYLWATFLWIIFGRHVPQSRPTGGSAAALWDLGEMVGRPALLAVASFLAYLLGSMLEVNPERLWRYGGRPPWADTVINATRIGRRALEFVRSPALSPTTQNGIIRAVSVNADPEARTRIFVKVLTEIRQYATRLQASHPELYDKYDRLIAEARFRFNITPPLVVLLVAVGCFSGAGYWAGALTIISAAIVMVTLLRQVADRVNQANEVIAQAVIVGLVQFSLESNPDQTELSRTG